MGDPPAVARLTAADLRRLPAPEHSPVDCSCANLSGRGWESVGQPLTLPLFERLGTLRPPGDDEPTLDEWPGSRYWAAETPISPAHFPCNRSEVWACVRCGRGFLQYTEAGGYYVDHRVRAVDPALVAAGGG